MGKIIKNTVMAIMFILCAMFIFRCCLVSDKSVFDDLTVTDSLRSAYSDGESVIYTAHQYDELSEDGYFSAYAFYYNPESGEVQFAVRWNDSVYEYTEMDEGHEYAFHLLNEATGEIYPAEAIDSKEKLMYNYRKLTVPGMVIGQTDQITAVMELRDGFESTQVMKYDGQELEEYKVKGKLLDELTK